MAVSFGVPSFLLLLSPVLLTFNPAGFGDYGPVSPQDYIDQLPADIQLAGLAQPAAIMDEMGRALDVVSETAFFQQDVFAGPLADMDVAISETMHELAMDLLFEFGVDIETSELAFPDWILGGLRLDRQMEPESFGIIISHPSTPDLWRELENSAGDLGLEIAGRNAYRTEWDVTLSGSAVIERLDDSVLSLTSQVYDLDRDSAISRCLFESVEQGAGMAFCFESDSVIREGMQSLASSDFLNDPTFLSLDDAFMLGMMQRLQELEKVHAFISRDESRLYLRTLDDLGHMNWSRLLQTIHNLANHGSTITGDLAGLMMGILPTSIPEQENDALDHFITYRESLDNFMSQMLSTGSHSIDISSNRAQLGVSLSVRHENSESDALPALLGFVALMQGLDDAEREYWNQYYGSMTPEEGFDGESWESFEEPLP